MLLTPSDTDGPGSGWVFLISGRDIFIKVANQVPAYAFRDSNILVTKASTDGALVITVQSTMPAYFVALYCDVPGHFSDAAFDLIPVAPRTVVFRPDQFADLEAAAQSLIVRDLYSATCR